MAKKKRSKRRKDNLIGHLLTPVNPLASPQGTARPATVHRSRPKPRHKARPKPKHKARPRSVHRAKPKEKLYYVQAHFPSKFTNGTVTGGLHEILATSKKEASRKFRKGTTLKPSEVRVYGGFTKEQREEAKYRGIDLSSAIGV